MIGRGGRRTAARGCARARENLLAYRAERLPLSRFIPLAGALVFLARGPAGAIGPGLGLVVSLVLAWGLVAAFRLWDDLADLPEDRRRRPERVLCGLSTPDLRAFSLTLAALLAASAAVFAAWAPAKLGGFVLLLAYYGIYYGGFRERIADRALRAHAALLKYGAFVALLAPAAAEPVRAAAAAFLAYFAMCAYELAHDARARRARAAAPLLCLDALGAIFSASRLL